MPTVSEVQARVVERADLVDRLIGGDADALTDLLTYATGVAPRSVRVTPARR